MKIIFRTGLIFSLAAFLSAAVYAQATQQATTPASSPAAPSASSNQGTGALPMGQTMLCREDIKKFCTTGPNDSSTLSCLYYNQDSLSKGCLTALNKHNTAWKDATENGIPPVSNSPAAATPPQKPQDNEYMYNQSTTPVPPTVKYGR